MRSLRIPWILGLAVLAAGCRPKIQAPSPVPPQAGPAETPLWTVQASSVQVAEDWSRPANAVDGDMATRWSSDFSDPQWIQVDLGATSEVAGLRISWENAYARAYDVITSADGEKWMTAYSTTEGDGGEDAVHFRSRAARFVKIVCKQRGTGFGYSIWEIGLEGPEAEPVFTASSVSGVHSPVHLLDAGSRTPWRSVGSTDEWLQVDLRKPRVFGRLLLGWGDDYARAFDVSV